MARVLVVDDNPATRRFVGETLTLEGHEVIECDGGATAIETCLAAVPDLVLIDLCLSDMRGTDVLQRLRREPATARVPIIAFTGAPEEVPDDLDGCSFDDLVSKPADPEVLAATVNAHLLGHHESATSPSANPRAVLADDHAARSTRIRLHLRRLGFDVTPVRTTDEAVEQVRRLQPSLLVVDLMMPRAGALELTRTIRSDPELAATAVVIVSPTAADSVHDRLTRRAGADAYVPLRPDLGGLHDAVSAIADGIRHGSSRRGHALDDEVVPRHSEPRRLRELREAYREQIEAHRAEDRGRAELDVLQLLADATGDLTDLDSVIEEALSRCLHAIGASRGAVFLTELDGGFSMRAHFGDVSRAPGLRLPCHEELFHRVTGTGETVLVDTEFDTSPMGSPDADSARQPGPVEPRGADDPSCVQGHHHPTTIVTPVASGQERYGVLVVEVPADEDLRAWMRFLQLVGVGLGFAVANARRADAPAFGGGQPVDAEPERDPLTGLMGPGAFERSLEAAVGGITRGERGALFVVDVDRIRHVNDALGRRTGDELLRGVAGCLQRASGARTSLARLHGDVFALLVSGIDDEVMAAAHARRILAALDEPVRCQGYTLYTSASIGVVVYPDHGKRAALLLQRASTALGVAKDRGGNAYEVYTHRSGESIWQRLTLDQGLRAALERREFLLHFQPILDLRSGRIDSVEALLRWDRPLQGLTPAANFIRTAEETGLIVPIGRWVLDTAARQAVSWRTAQWPVEGVAVNVAAREFHEGCVYDSVARTLDETAVPPAMLSLEITETVALADLDGAVRQLERLRALGVHIALDDFGSGYSSLRYVQELPVDTLKIDRSIVANGVEHRRGEPILAGIVDLAHRLGMRVVAEGIETQTALELVHALGCDAAQGYHIGRPLPPEELEKALGQG